MSKLPHSYFYQLTTTEKNNFNQVPDWIHQISNRMRQSGFQVYLVGGAVRDLLWGQIPEDWDLATDAIVDEVEKVFPNTVPTGRQFGTLTILVDERSVEMTTFREDSGYSDGRHPDMVRFGKDILADLARRDFTINAMAYNLTTGELVDPFGGRADAYKQILRAVGDPGERFAEDGLRMFRFYRFLATRDLKAHRATDKAISPSLALSVSIDRIRDEFSKIIQGKNARRGLNGLKQSELFHVFLPEIESCYPGKESTSPNLNIWEHLLTTTEAIQPLLHLRLAAFLHDIAKPATISISCNGIHFYGHDEQGAILCKEVLTRMHFPEKIVNTVTCLVHRHMFSFAPNTSDGAIRRFIAKTGPELIPDLLELRRADIVGTGRIDYATWEYWQELSERITELNKSGTVIPVTKLAIGGHELMENFGLAPGPLIGVILNFLWQCVMDNPEVNNKADLMKLAGEEIERQKAK